MKSEQKFLFFIFFAYILFQFLFIFITGYNGLYGQDGHEYYRYSKNLQQFLIQGTHPGSYFWTAMYPLGGAVLSFLTGPLLALQLISVVSSAWILVLLVSYLQNEFPGREKEIALYAGLFLGLSPYFFRYSVSVMSDVPALALIITAWYFTDRFYKLKIIQHFYFAAFCISAGLFTRIGFLPITIPVFVFIGIHLIRNFNFKHLIIVTILVVIPYAITAYFKGEDSANIFEHNYVTNWSIFNFFRKEFVILDGNVSYFLPNILNVALCFVHPGYVLAGAVFIFYLIYNKRQPSFLFFSLVFAIVGYCLFIAGIPYQNNRYMIAVVPFFLVICFPSFLTILSWFHYRKKLFNLVLFMVFSFQFMLLYRAVLPLIKLNKLEQKISEKVISFNSPVVYTLGMDGALSSYGYRGTIINLYGHLYTDIVDSSLLLINKTGFEIQWKGKSPMLNYNFIQKHSSLKLITTFNDGWEVYEVRKEHSNAHTGIPGK